MYRVKITLCGELSAEWFAYSNHLEIGYRNGITYLYGTVTDHSALFGILRNIRDCNHQILELHCRQIALHEGIESNRDTGNHER